MMKLYRSQRDKKLTGLCGGLAEILGVDATLLRIIFVVTVFFSGGAAILLYIVASLVIPKESAFDGRPMFNNPPPPPGNSGTSYPRYDSRTPRASYPAQNPVPPVQNTASSLDDRMEELERKALWKEIEELKAKLAKYEKEDKNNGNI